MDHRKIIVVEDTTKANDGWAKAFGLLFVAIMALALVDRVLSASWSALMSLF
jgi:hypothetical protein